MNWKVQCAPTRKCEWMIRIQGFLLYANHFITSEPCSRRRRKKIENFWHVSMVLIGNVHFETIEITTCTREQRFDDNQIDSVQCDTVIGNRFVSRMINATTEWCQIVSTNIREFSRKQPEVNFIFKIVSFHSENNCFVF